MAGNPVRNWCFTVNLAEGISDDEARAKLAILQGGFDDNRIKGAVFQLEIAPATGRRHIQGFANLASKQRMSWLKNFIHGLLDIQAHLEPCRNVKASIEYCQKQESRMPGTEPVIVGALPKAGQGKRSDLLDVKAKLDEGASESRIADEHFVSWVRCHKAFERYRAIKQTPRNPANPVSVEVFIGPPGCGKTRRAVEENPGCYMKSNATGIWFDLYANESCVVFDDFYGSLPYEQLLNICDRYACKVQCKGGVAEFTSTKLVLTSNRSHLSWYSKLFAEGSKDPMAFARRVTKWVIWRSTGVVYEGADWEAASTALSHMDA